MYRFLCVWILVLSTLPLFGQVEPGAVGGEVTIDDAQMMTPPPVSGNTYPQVGLADVRSNYIDGGVTFSASYVDNLLAGQLPRAVSGEIYTVQPLIALNKTTPRLNTLLTYQAGFTFYEPLSQLNYIDQNASLRYQYRLSERLSIFAQDAFLQSSNAYNTPFTVGGTSATGAGGVADVITPFGNRLANDASGGAAYQFSLNAMVGAAVESGVLQYPDLSQVPGLANSAMIAASGFYNRRLSRTNYAGAMMLYRHITTSPTDSTIDTYTPSLFYTLYFQRNFSVSAVVGAERYRTTGTGFVPAEAWTPSASVSAGWQGRHATAALAYSRDVAGGNGLVGSYAQQNANGDITWQINRLWSAVTAASYSNAKNEGGARSSTGAGGHSIYATASLARNFRFGLRVEAGYNRIHSQYTSISALARNPDSNRGYISIAYFFSKPIGR